MKYAISFCYIFPYSSVWFMDNLLCLCNVWKGWSYANADVSVWRIFINGQFYLKYYFLRHRNSPSKRFIKLSTATSLFSILIHQNTKSTTGLNIYSILEDPLKALLNVSYWFGLTNLTETSSRHHFWEYILKCISISLFFQYWLFFFRKC